MLLPCEIAVKSLIPALRSTIAKELIHKHGLKQKDVADLLGVTQTAVSKYVCEVRGTVLKIDEVEEFQSMIKEIVVALVDGNMSKYEFIAKFCIACKNIRKKGLMCKLCKISDQTIKIEQCHVCDSLEV